MEYNAAVSEAKRLSEIWHVPHIVCRRIGGTDYEVMGLSTFSVTDHRYLVEATHVWMQQDRILSRMLGSLRFPCFVTLKHHEMQGG